VLLQEEVVLFQAERGFFHAQLEVSGNKILTQLEELAFTYRIKPDLIEKAQQPGLAILEVGGLAVAIPHLHGTSDKLITAWTLHPVYTQISAAYPYRVLGSPGPCRIILGGNQPVTWIHRCRHRCTEIYVA